jgi:glycosyltransferase involved in cell wall biosynthesis
MKIFKIGKFDFIKYGGIEKVCEDLINELKKDYEITYLFFGEENKIEKSYNLNKFCSKINFTISNQPVSLKFIINYFKILKSKPDIIHVHLPNYLSLFCLLFTPKNFLNKTIIHWHSDIVNKHFLFSFLSYFESLILKKVYTIVTTSNEYTYSSVQLRNVLHKVNVIPLCINKKCSNSITIVNESKENNILTVGRLVPYKGFDLLIKACSIINFQYKLFIVGNGPEYNNLINLIDLHKLNDRVFILTNVQNNDLNILYKTFNIFCLPSINRAEAYGISMLEAVSYGLPTISFEIHGSGLNFVNEMGIKVQTISHIDLSHNLISLLNNFDLRKKISSNNINYYNSNFNFNNYISLFHNLYNTIE